MNYLKNKTLSLTNLLKNIYSTSPIANYNSKKIEKYYKDNKDDKIVNYFNKKQKNRLFRFSKSHSNAIRYYNYIKIDKETKISLLHYIIKDNRKELFNKLISTCPFILHNSILDDNNNSLRLTPIQFACAQNNVFFLEALHELGANTDVLVSGNMNLLHLSTYSGSVKCMDYIINNIRILNNYNNVNESSDNSSNNNSIVDYKKSIVDSKTLDNQTSLHLACIFNKLDAASLLLDYNCDLYVRDSMFLTPIEQAALNNSSDLIIILLKHYYNLDKLYKNKDISKNSNVGLIHLAVSSKKGTDSVNALCNYDRSNVNSICYSNLKSTPLIFAVLNNNVKAVSDLLNHGALVEKADYLGNTPLHYAVEKENLKIIKILIEFGADIFKKNNEGLSPFNIVHGKDNKDLQLYFIALSGNKNKFGFLKKEDFMFKNNNNVI